MSSQKRWKRLFFRWTALKGITSILFFSVLALFTEYILVRFFLSNGLVDNFLITETLQIPLTNSLFNLTVSPLFHLIPLGVVTVLVASWMYLTKYMAVVPHRMGTGKKVSTTQKRRYTKFRRTLSSLFRRLSTPFLRIRNVSYLIQRLFFARAALKSTATILTVFIGSILLLYALVNPELIHERVNRFYAENPTFLWFVLGTISKAGEIGKALSPIGWLATTINSVLIAGAPGLRSFLEGVGAPIAKPIAKIDLVWKYALCQNASAWISAIVTLAYGRFTLRLSRRKP